MQQYGSEIRLITQAMSSAHHRLFASPTTTRRGALRLAAGLALVGPRGLAQTRQERGEQLVLDSLEKMGGKAFLAVGTTRIQGRAYSFYNAQVRGLARITVYDRYEEMLPNQDSKWLPVSRREVYTEKGDYYSLFRNGRGWEITFQGARPLAPDVMDRYRIGVRRDLFYFLRYRLDEPGLYYYHTGVEIVDNQPTDAVEITDAEGDAFTVYLRQNDGLPHQQLYLRRDPKTRIPFEEKTIWSKYRPSGYALLPWNVRKERDGDKIYEQFASSFEVNRQLKGKIFDLPAKITMLDADV